MNEQHPYSSDSACGVTSYTSVAFWDSVWSDLMCYFHQCRLYRPHRNGWALVIIFVPLLLFFVQKFRGVILFIYCIKFDHNFLIVVCFVFNLFLLILFFKFSTYYLISFKFYIKYSPYSFYWFFFSNWILLLICPLTFDFKLILHQIYHFFIAILNFFIVFFLILPPNILLIYNLAFLFSGVCFLQDWIPGSYLGPWVLRVDMGWTLSFL
jgi:hypothetical protein